MGVQDVGGIYNALCEAAVGATLSGGWGCAFDVLAGLSGLIGDQLDVWIRKRILAHSIGQFQIKLR